MQVTKRIHAIKIPFTIPVTEEMQIERFAYAYLVFGEKIYLIDSGVAGSESTIFQYIEEQGRDPKEVASLILTHSHPDHIGAAKSIQRKTGCTVIAHKNEQQWIEDTEQQFCERPVPGFRTLVDGPVSVDRIVNGGEILELEQDIFCTIIHTPGHSKGSISLLFEEEKSLFTADALAFPGDLPIYEDICSSVASVNILRNIQHVENVFSSWEPPLQGREKIDSRMDESMAYLHRIHTAVLKNCRAENQHDSMELCRKVVQELDLPPFAVNPLVAKAFESSLAVEDSEKLFAW